MAQRCRRAPLPTSVQYRALVLPNFTMYSYLSLYFLQLLFLSFSSAGELTENDLETIKTIIEEPETFSIPTWMLNRQKDRETGKNFQNVSNNVDVSLRNDIERMKKIRYVQQRW